MRHRRRSRQSNTERRFASGLRLHTRGARSLVLPVNLLEGEGSSCRILQIWRKAGRRPPLLIERSEPSLLPMAMSREASVYAARRTAIPSLSAHHRSSVALCSRACAALCAAVSTERRRARVTPHARAMTALGNSCGHAVISKGRRRGHEGW